MIVELTFVSDSSKLNRKRFDLPNSCFDCMATELFDQFNNYCFENDIQNPLVSNVRQVSDMYDD